MSLDNQYLDFSTQTTPIFAQYPRLEGLRYPIFNQIFAQRLKASRKDMLKHWVRPLVRRKRTEGELNPADVLLWIESQRATNIESLVDVYRELTSRGIKTQIVAYKGPPNMPPGTLRFAFPSRARVPGWAKRAWKDFCALYPDLNEPGLKRAFLYTIASHQGLFEELDRLLTMIRPKITIMLSTQVPGGASLAVNAREHGVESLLLQHGILQVFYTPVVTDYMLTWGESSNQIVEPIGVPAEKLIIVGSPRHDKMMPSTNGSARTAFLNALNLPDRPTLVFFSNGNDLIRNGSAPVECAAWLEAAAAQYADQINIVVRLHPNEDGSLYTNCPHLHVTKNTPDLHTTLDGCDWTASLCSTVLYEGLLYRKPVWQFYAEGWPDLADNWKTGLATRIASQVQLNNIIGAALRGDTSQDDNVVERVFLNHGRATQAVVDVIEAHLKRNQEEFISSLNLEPSRATPPRRLERGPGGEVSGSRAGASKITLLARVLRGSRAVVRRVYDRTIVPFWLRQLGVEVGTGCRFEGMPIVKPGRGTSIRLGKHVTLFSRPDSNPRGVSHPVILAALAPGATIEIGDHTSMTGVSTTVRAGLTIGKHVQIGPGACLWDNDGHALDTDERRTGGRQQTIKRAPIVIEDDVFIGARAIILKGVTIGKGAIVGAGAIVTKDVKPGDIVAGNPARVIGSVTEKNAANTAVDQVSEVYEGLVPKHDETEILS